MQSVRPDMPDNRELVVDVGLETEMKTVLELDMPKVTETLDGLSKEGSKIAAKVVGLLFSSQCTEYRNMAITTLGKMKNEHARKVLSRRASWLSGAPKEEKIRIRALLTEA